MHTSRLKLLQIMPSLLHGIVFVYNKNNMAAKLNPHMVNLKTMALLLPFYFLPGGGERGRHLYLTVQALESFENEGKIISQKISHINVSKYQNFKISKYRSIKVSKSRRHMYMDIIELCSDPMYKV